MGDELKKIVDKNGRDIKLIIGGDDTVRAYCGEEEVGQISFWVTDNGGDYTKDTRSAQVHTMNVIEGFQRAGIATEIIKYAKEEYDSVTFASDPGTVEDKDDIHYSEEGLAFKRYCELKEITKDPDEHFEDNEDNDEEYEDFENGNN